MTMTFQSWTWPLTVIFVLAAMNGCGLSATSTGKNSLKQHTGEPGSTVPRSNPPHYPNTSGNIVAPPGNPGGNPSGFPPMVGGTETQQTAWPEGR
jgi:hypothetical protein